MNFVLSYFLLLLVCLDDNILSFELNTHLGNPILKKKLSIVIFLFNIYFKLTCFIFSISAKELMKNK